MKYFAITYKYDPESAAIAEHRPIHREFIGKLNDEGKILGSGPHPDAEGGALIVVKLGDDATVDTATELMNGDPFYSEGALNDRTVREWNPVINSFS